MFCSLQKRSIDLSVVECAHWSLVGPSLPSPRFCRSLLAEGRPRPGRHAPPASTGGCDGAGPVLASAVLQVEVASGVGGQPRWEADLCALGKEALVSPSRGAVRRHVGAVRCDAFLEGDLVGICLIPSGQDFAFQNSLLLSCLKSRGIGL